jgi:hypothetical protein
MDDSLTPEERAHIMAIQDRLIELFLDRSDALDAGDAGLAGELQNEIGELMRQRDDITLWAVVGAK